jgi:hypothetical protein
VLLLSTSQSQKFIAETAIIAIHVVKKECCKRCKSRPSIFEDMQMVGLFSEHAYGLPIWTIMQRMARADSYFLLDGGILRMIAERNIPEVTVEGKTQVSG